MSTMKEHDLPWWRSLVFRVIGVNTVIVGALLLFGLFRLDATQRLDVQRSFGQELRAISATTAIRIDAKDLAQIRSDEDASSAAFRRVRSALAGSAAANGLDEDAIYILRPTASGLDRMEFVVMLQQRTFVGDPYLPPPEVQAAYREVLEERRPGHTALFTDAHGTFISGLAPILDGRGVPVAILHADFGVTSYLETVRQRTLNLLWVGVFGFLILLVLAYLIQKHFMRRIRSLLGATEAIRRQEYDHRIALDGTDELTVVGTAMNFTLAQLQERFEMLKFLPQHTLEMISRTAQTGGAQLQDAERKTVVVLETDIRGFTRFSADRAPEAVIEMLNRILGVQAELIGQHGGAIDKFMGDAVLAIFDGPDKEQDALRCLDALFGAVQDELDAPEDAPLGIGAGLSVGEVVMGNMGSRDRMEYAMIGATVNLAARMCSEARAGEAVVADDFESHARQLGIALAPCESIRFKGLEAPVSCLRISFDGGDAERA